MRMGGLYPVCIYIPIWLDLLCVLKREVYADGSDLHSNMVRFIILKLSNFRLYL